MSQGPPRGLAGVLTRFAILGDVHAEDRRLAAALAHVAPLGLDGVLCVGDIVDGRGDAARCVRLLQQAGATCVRGNHDRWWSQGKQMDFADGTPGDALPPDAAAWLAALPPTARFETPAGTLLLCHGLADNDMVGVEPEDEGYALEANVDLQQLIDRADYRLIINGHTHSRMVRRFGRKLTIVNAGTLKGTKEPGFGVVDLAAETVLWSSFTEDDHVVPIAQVAL